MEAHFATTVSQSFCFNCLKMVSRCVSAVSQAVETYSVLFSGLKLKLHRQRCKSAFRVSVKEICIVLIK